jgi:regulator of sigma E protease
MPELLQNTLLYVGSFVLVLSLVVFVHEFGHFQVGRWCGIGVKSFSIGLGSEWFGWTDKHGTRWKISKIPLGGFVSWIDDTDGSSTLPASEENQALSMEEARRRGHFRAMPIWKRAATVAAGPVTNFVFAIFAFASVAFLAGRDVTDYGQVPARIGGVVADTPAAAAGLRRGEVVVAVDGAPISGWAGFQDRILGSGGQPLRLSLEDADGTAREVSVTPRLTSRPGPDGATEQAWALGLQLGVHNDERTVEPINLLEALNLGAGGTWAIVARTGAYLGGILTGQNSGGDIAGPLGIFKASGQIATVALDASADDLGSRIASLALALLGWAGMLSVAVGIVNLLPIPVLDGGHLLFYGIEAVRGGRPLPPTAQEWAYRAGFAVMASLFLFATWNDITRLFPGAR